MTNLRSPTRARATAWIDPLSNIIRPRGVSTRAVIRSVLTGEWPKAGLQPLLHEMTHHWTFHSIVGGTLALMQMHCARDTPEFYPDARNRQRTFDYMVTLNGFLRLIRPLSEGLALFAEYDLTPGDSSVCSKPLTWASVALSPPGRFLNLDDPSDAASITSELLTLRLQRPSVERKMSFLSVPTSEYEAAYFAGYMQVKRWLADLVVRVPQFADADLFLFYMRSFFFDDAALVPLLLDGGDGPLARIRRIVARFEARIKQLNEPDLALAVSIFERANSGPPNTDHALEFAGLKLTDAKRIEGVNSYQRMFDELRDDESLSQTHRQMLAGQRLSLERRTLAYLASEPAEIQVKNGILTAWPTPRDFEYPALTGGRADVPCADTDGPIQGWLAVVLRPQTYHLSVLIGRDMQVLDVISPGVANQDQEWLDLVRHPICSPVFVEKEFETYSRWSKGYFDGMPEALGDVVTAVRSEIDGALTRIQRASLRRWLAPSSNSGVVSPQFSELEIDSSLWHLFSGNLQMFETCMALGILRNRDVMLPSVHDHLLQLGWDSWAAMRFCSELSQKTGFTMLRNSAGGIQWLI